ncbi:MAG TPA: serine/threonine-protein kinase, partial [Gemmatimonadaceae bacterium]|nr:serine/threonine-protein kinase [Gemmatimonadaceae bacterium]
IPVCEVLAAAHAQGLVHRDIKPSNIFLHLDRSGEVVKVIDFGIAKLVGDAPDTRVRPGTATGLLVGTPVYIAPERFDGAAYDGAVDVFAVGVTLYEMLSGRLPFEADGNEWVRAMVRMLEPPVSLRKLDASIPAALDDAVRRTLARDPRARPSARELGELLAAFPQPTARAAPDHAAGPH